MCRTCFEAFDTVSKSVSSDPPKLKEQLQQQEQQLQQQELRLQQQEEQLQQRQQQLQLREQRHQQQEQQLQQREQQLKQQVQLQEQQRLTQKARERALFDHLAHERDCVSSAPGALDDVPSPPSFFRGTSNIPHRTSVGRI